MILKLHLSDFGLAIDSPLARPNAVNYRPSSWPPAPDDPVVVDADGKIISRFKDSIWRLDTWAQSRICLNFGDGPDSRASRIDKDNANLLRIIAALWLWGPNGVRAPETLRYRFSKLRALFALCTRRGILASNLMRFPRVASEFSGSIAPSTFKNVLTYLHEILAAKDILGFILFDKQGLIDLEANLPDWEGQQTPYIPPRIWVYQVTRLKECLDDYLAHKEKIADCYHFCLEAYRENYGTLTAAFGSKSNNHRSPFSCSKNIKKGKIAYYGKFRETARRFGIEELITRWIGPTQEKEIRLDLNSFAKYLRLISGVGSAYLLNFSLMRVSEGLSLRSDSLYVEKDPQFGDIYIIQGETTKTKREDNALWPTSPSAKIAVDALKSVAQLHLICLKELQDSKKDEQEINNPKLIQRALEPWSKNKKDQVHLQPSRQTYEIQLVLRYPKLFDPEQLRIRKSDLEIARFITPTLDSDRFAVGKIWPLAYHQLRRTGAVNMQASGLISDSSLQYLLKHATRAMSLYYGRNYSRLRLNDEARDIYVRTMYEVLGKEFSSLLSKNFISPHGEKRKLELVQLINNSDIKKLAPLAEGGEISCRAIALGYCMNRDPCPYGGIDSVANCGGGATGKPCADVLYATHASSKVRLLDLTLDERLTRARVGTPLYLSLQAQKRSVENYKNVTNNG